MYDIVVCGGGSAGAAVALFAAEGGKDVALIEQFGELGGILTSDCLGYVMDAKDKKGFVETLRAAVGTQFEPETENFKFDTEQMKYYLERRLVNAGVDIFYFSKIFDADVENGKITAVSVLNKDGFLEIRGKIFVDATGDGDVGFFAGCGFEFGADGKEGQPMSYLALLTGLDREEVKFFTNNYPGFPIEAGKKNMLAELKRAGFTPSYLMPTLSYIREGIYNFGVNHQYGSGIDSKTLTKATIEGRHEVFQAVNALKSLGGIWKNISVIATPTYIGVRDGRRLKGEYTVTVDDLITGAKHEDSVCRVTFNVDVHTKGGYENADVKMKPYDIPLRALKAKGIENLYMAGRCISGDYLAHASYRVSGNTFTMGQNLGTYLAEHF